jgi:pimeloyl-ACP methyl ester carboxylesterase
MSLARRPGGAAADYAVSHPDRLLSLVINSNPAGLSGGDIVEVYESLRPKGFDEMPPDFRELGPSYRAANPVGVRRWLELEHRAITSRPFRQRAANVITEGILNRLQVPTLLTTGEADLYSPPALIRMIASQIPAMCSITRAPILIRRSRIVANSAVASGLARDRGAHAMYPPERSGVEYEPY